MGSSLTGSAPKASFSTQPTILPAQQDLMNMLVGILQTGDPVRGVQHYGGTYAAPLNSLQTTSLAGLEQIAGGGTTPQPTAQQTGAMDQSFNALNSALDYQAPQIDSTAAFQSGVVDPLTKAFETSILPAISGQYAGSAGGAYSSGRQQASQQAGANLTDTLASQGSRFAYDAASANQTAELQANQQRLAALGLAPAITGMPTALDTALQGITSTQIQQLLATLGAGAVPYGVAQTQVAGEYGEFTRQQQEEQQIIADFIAAMGAPTVNTLGVGSGGSSGILPGLFQGAGSALGGWLSDERVKEDIEQVGEVDGFPLYKFKYIGDPTRRIGLMAQDVEKRLPSAVGRVPGTGIKTVNYGTVLEHVLSEAA